MTDFIDDWFARLKNSGFASAISSRTSSDNLADQRSVTNIYAQSFYVFIVFNCYVLCFLSNYIRSEEQLDGLLFLLSALIVNTCFIFHYPLATLSNEGLSKLRRLLWIFVFLCMSIFLFLLRSYSHVCSSFFVSAAVGAKIFRQTPIAFGHTFTHNEIVLVTSLSSNALFTFLNHFSNSIKTYKEEVLIVEQSIVWLVSVICLTTTYKVFRKTLLLFATALATALALQFTPLCLIVLKKNPFVWLFNFIFYSSYQRVCLLASWLGLFTCLTLVFAVQKHLTRRTARDSMDRHTQLTSMRKVFHLLICVVYLLGLYYDRSLLFLCSYGMLIVLVLAETIRYQKIGWLGERIQDLQALFIDEKDLRSELVLSHIYLLIGFSVPIWISDFGEFNLAQLSGLITVGVGDSFASLIGSRYGRHRLPGSSKKSLEGSLGLVFSILLVLLALAGLGYFDPFRLKNVLLVLGLLGFTAFTEAYTNDNDNLVLSIVAYPFLNSLHT